MYIRDAMRLLRGPPSRQQRPSLLPHDCTLHPTSRIETLGPKHEEQASSASSRSHARSRYDSSEEYCTFTRTGTLALTLLVHFLPHHMPRWQAASVGLTSAFDVLTRLRLHEDSPNSGYGAETAFDRLPCPAPCHLQYQV